MRNPTSLRIWLAVLACVGALAGCEEELTVPGQCPDLCPGGQPEVRDTIITATQDGDTTFFGYTGRGEVASLLVSNGLAAGEARAWVAFPQRPDSVTVSGAVVPYTVDSVLFSFNLVVRDTLVHGLKLYLHRLPRETDSLSTFDQIAPALTEATLIDSIEVGDDVKNGTIRVVIDDPTTLANLIPEADSGYLTVGLRLAADEATGVRVGSLTGTGAASFITYAKAAVDDAALQPQTLTYGAERNGWVRNDPPTPPDPDLLYVGRVPSARTIMRFPIPDFLQDSTIALVRATLELTPAETIRGLRGDLASLEVRGVTKDIGAKSTATLTRVGSVELPLLSDALVSVEIIGIVQAWRGPNGIPATVLIGLNPDAGSFHQPVFRSTRSATGVPTLHITYLRPSAVERP